MTEVDSGWVAIASLSDTGRQRAHNEDACTEGRLGDGALLLMVADGMGGHAGGATASRTAVDTARSVVEAAATGSDALLMEAFEAANRSIHEAAGRDASLHGMGTTGVALLLAPGGPAWVANVGDSRAYRLRGECLEQLTRDHSFVAELQRRGVIDAEQAAVHPRRHQVLRSLGVESGVEVDVERIELEDGDCFLLCSDGLSGVIADDEIAFALSGAEPAEAARRLVDLANERGGPDNITVQIARISRADGGWNGAGLRGRPLLIAGLGLILALGVAWLWLV